MSKTLNTAEVADLLGITEKSADKELRRWGIVPVGREPGRGGRNLYPAAEVRKAAANRPGRGARTDLRR